MTRKQQTALLIGLFGIAVALLVLLNVWHPTVDGIALSEAELTQPMVRLLSAERVPLRDWLIVDTLFAFTYTISYTYALRVMAAHAPPELDLPGRTLSWVTAIAILFDLAENAILWTEAVTGATRISPWLSALVRLKWLSTGIFLIYGSIWVAARLRGKGQTMSTMPPEFDAFEKLYNTVRETLDDFVKEGTKAGPLTPQEKAWFSKMSADFRAEYLKWPQATGPVGQYLVLFNDAPASLRQAAHAFLHVAYDLPRVIAPTLNGLSTNERIERRALFLAPAPIFRKRFMENLRGGAAGWLLRPLGWFEPGEVLSYWLLNLRAVAWIHAEILADGPHPSPYPPRLASALLEAGNNSLGKIWKLDNSAFWRMAPAVIVTDHPLATSILVASIILAGGIARWRNARIATEIASLGAWIQIETSRALLDWTERTRNQPSSENPTNPEIG